MCICVCGGGWRRGKRFGCFDVCRAEQSRREMNMRLLSMYVLAYAWVLKDEVCLAGT